MATGPEARLSSFFHPHTIIGTIQHGVQQQPVVEVRVIHDIMCRGAEGEEWKYENISRVARSMC